MNPVCFHILSNVCHLFINLVYYRSIHKTNFKHLLNVLFFKNGMFIKVLIILSLLKLIPVRKLFVANRQHYTNSIQLYFLLLNDEFAGILFMNLQASIRQTKLPLAVKSITLISECIFVFHNYLPDNTEISVMKLTISN